MIAEETASQLCRGSGQPGGHSASTLASMACCQALHTNRQTGVASWGLLLRCDGEPRPTTLASKEAGKPASQLQQHTRAMMAGSAQAMQHGVDRHS